MDLEWRKASACSGENGCVEVFPAAGYVYVRSSRHGPTLEFTSEEWTAFVAAVKAGEFDGED